MLALSPPLFSTAYGWPLDGLITQNLQQDCNEANSYHSFFDFPANIQIQHDFAPENSISVCSKGAVNDNNDDPMKKVTKKLNHNASERDRRKRVNKLYSFLRSLLPMSSDRMKKVSIPGTVSRALKYITELQQEVERLKNKKEKLLLCSSSTNIRNLSAKETMIQNTSSVVTSVSVSGEKDVVIQMISSFDTMNKNKDIGLLSKALEYLEEEEDSLVLINVTTFKCHGEERLLNTLHFQVHGGCTTEAENLKEKLSSLYQQ